MTGRLTFSGDIGGINLNRTVTREGDSGNASSILLPAAKSGTLTTRTSATVGTLTMGSSEHGIGTGQLFDLYWADGRRTECVAGSVSGASIPFTSGDGTDLPITTTPITVSPITEIGFSVDVPAGGAQMWMVFCKAKGRVTFWDDATPAVRVFRQDLDGTTPLVYVSDSGRTDPLASASLGKVRCSQSSTAETEFDLGILYDGTP